MRPADDLTAKKSLGQNFLVDTHAIARIIATIGSPDEGAVVEIGPGQGALTRALLAAGHTITAIEKDPRMVDYLTRTLLTEYPQTFTLRAQDALTLQAEDLPAPLPLRLVGNLPYNVGTQIVVQAIRKPDLYTRLTFMLQKEVVQRIVAHPGSKDWGRLGLWCHLYTDAKRLFDVPPSAFRPRPKVTSSIVQLTLLAQPRYPHQLQKLENIVATAFQQRRKMIGTSLKGLYSPQQLEACRINPQARPETMATEDFCRLSLCC